MGQVFWGIFFGALAALCQSFSYLFSRRFLAQVRPSGRLLFGISHIQMGAISLVALPFLFDRLPESWGAVILPLLSASGFYLFAQWLLFQALKTTESSQIAPLLGLKIPILAIATLLILGKATSPLGWVAVLLCACAGFLISPPGRIRGLRVIGLALLMCLGYAGSDFSIPILVRALESSSSHPVFAAVAATYSFCGLVGLLMLLSGALGPSEALFEREVHLGALPYSLAWISAMAVLFACFTLIGVVFGNMIQSTRALLSVLLGLAVTRAGYLKIENLHSRAVFYSRLGGAALMTGAILLFFYTRR